MQKNAEISERITKIIEYLGVNPNNFSKKLNYDRSQTVYDVMNGKSAPSFDFFKRFMLSEYSEIISINWMLTGRGSMVIDKKEEDKSNKHAFIIPKDWTECPICKEKDKLIDSYKEDITWLRSQFNSR